MCSGGIFGEAGVCSGISGSTGLQRGRWPCHDEHARQRDGLRRVDGGLATLPSVRMFYGTPSEHLWEDSDGVVHSIPQGEGGEQGDPMMPLLFSVGQHHALEVVNRSLRDDKKVMAFLDDNYFCSEPNRVGVVYAAIEEALQHHAGISIHGGKTKVWNASGVRPPACDVLEQIARTVNPAARVWRGSGVPTEQQGMKILGTLLWDILISSGDISLIWLRNSDCCWRGSPV